MNNLNDNRNTISPPAEGHAPQPSPIANRLQCLTLTGVDESVPVCALDEISRHFPFVEFGVLFSNSQAGQGRYPPFNWITDLARQLTVSPGTSVALHVCGSAVGDLLNGQGQVTQVVGAFSRIQLNFADNKYPVDALRKLLQRMPRTIFITQSRYPNDQANLWLALADLPNHAVLFDASGGNGMTPSSWPSPLEHAPQSGLAHKTAPMCGYAGGIAPGNIGQHLKTIASITKKKRFWLDMETGLRVNDKFDLRAALQCLATVRSIMDERDAQLEKPQNSRGCAAFVSEA